MKYTHLVFIIVVFLLLSCSEDGRPFQKDDFIASYAFTQKATGHLHATERAVPLHPSLLYSSDTLTIGEISDAAIHDGRVYVLDEKNGTLLYHPPEYDRPPQLQGGRGSGPGELAFPKQIAVTDSSLLIGIRGFIVKRYPGSMLSKDERIMNLSMPFRDFCTMDDKMYVLGVQASNHDLIHVFDMHGNRLDSFAAEFEGIDYFQRRQYTDGSIRCFPNRSAVVASLAFMGRLYAYSAQGRKRWVSTVDSFVPLKYSLITYNGRPAVQKEYRAEGYRDRIDGIYPLNDSLAIVQVDRSTFGGTSPSEIRSYVVDLASGDGDRLSTPLPRLAAMAEHRAVAAQNAPVPQYSIHRIEIR